MKGLLKSIGNQFTFKKGALDRIWIVMSVMYAISLIGVIVANLWMSGYEPLYAKVAWWQFAALVWFGMYVLSFWTDKYFTKKLFALVHDYQDLCNEIHQKFLSSQGELKGYRDREAANKKELNKAREVILRQDAEIKALKSKKRIKKAVKKTK